MGIWLDITALRYHHKRSRTRFWCLFLSTINVGFLKWGYPDMDCLFHGQYRWNGWWLGVSYYFRKLPYRSPFALIEWGKQPLTIIFHVMLIHFSWWNHTESQVSIIVHLLSSLILSMFTHVQWLNHIKSQWSIMRSLSFPKIVLPHHIRSPKKSS